MSEFFQKTEEEAEKAVQRLSNASSRKPTPLPPGGPPLMDVSAMHHPVRGPQLSARDRLKAELEALEDSDSETSAAGNSDDDKDTGKTSKVPGSGFGAQYLAKLGLKEGQSLRPGGAVQAYAPKVTGGFLSTLNSSPVPENLKEGAFVVIRGDPSDSNQSLDGACKIIRCSTKDKVAEVELATGERRRVKFSELRMASDLEEKRWLNVRGVGDAEAGTRKRPREEVDEKAAWIVPLLVVRVVGGDVNVGDKGTVVSVDRVAGEAVISISSVAPRVKVDCAHIQNVVPREGEQGMLLSGHLKGSLATVVQRVRAQGKGGNITGVIVRLSDERLIEVEPTDLCALGKP